MIPEGKMSVLGVLCVAVIGLGLVFLIGAYFVTEYGAPVVVLLGIAIWSAVSYSVPPLKMGYRPFNELVVVFPALTGVVVGTELVLTGSWTPFSVLVGSMHSLFCIHWFVISRLPDYTPDKNVGKVTSVVYLGRGNAPTLAGIYATLALVPIPLVALWYTPVILFAVVPYLWMVTGVMALDPYDPDDASEKRLENMHLTTLNAMFLSILMVLGG